MKKFIITGTYRTGSSALAEIIGLHPDVSCGWEWTNQVLWPNKINAGIKSLNGDFSSLPDIEREYMQEIHNSEKLFLGYRRLFRASNKWVIDPKYSIALFIDQFQAHLKLWKKSDIAIIHIIRSDNVAWLKSLGLAKATKSHFGNVYPDNMSVKWNLKEAEKRIIAKNWIDNQIATLKDCNIPYLPIIYEDFVADNNSTTERACHFLGCRWPYVPAGEPKAKIQSKGTKASIENIDELKKYLIRQGLDKSHILTN